MHIGAHVTLTHNATYITLVTRVTKIRIDKTITFHDLSAKYRLTSSLMS